MARLLDSQDCARLLAGALDVCDCLVPVTVTGLDLLQPATGRLLVAVGKGVNVGFLRTYEDIARADDVVLHKALTTHRPYQCSDIFTAEEWRSASAYVRVFRSVRLAHVLYIPLVASGHVIGTLNLGRTAAHGSFAPEEVALMADLAEVVTRALARELAAVSEASVSSPASSLLSELSARELDVALLVGRGLRDHEIADQLGLSPYTVKQYLKQVYRKTGLRSRVDLAVQVTRFRATEAVAQ
ncbi:helix-turn-helix transcriptional regulator [Nocardioides hungaricus]